MVSIVQNPTHINLECGLADPYTDLICYTENTVSIIQNRDFRLEYHGIMIYVFQNTKWYCFRFWKYNIHTPKSQMASFRIFGKRYRYSKIPNGIFRDFGLTEIYTDPLVV